MEKRLLLITRHRLNENNGGANASKGFVHCFAALFNDCSLIYPAFNGDTSPFIPAKCKLYPCHDHRSNIQKGLDCYRGVLSPLSAFTKKHLATHSYDIIVIDHSFIAASLVKAVKQTGATVITIHHNVERDFLRDNRHQFSLTFRLPYIHFAKKAEKDCLLYSDINLSVTAKDEAVFRSWHTKENLHLHQWGIFDYRPIADKQFIERAKGLTFVMTGSLSFIQSLYPILDFIYRYWPLLLEEYPDAKLLIAGRNPAKHLQEECEKQQGITLIPNPEDIASVVSQADYYICPINAGSGMKLRVMDGLRQGLPVLCHQESSAGYERLISSHCLFTYHDESSFSSALHCMLSSKVTHEYIYQSFRKNFSIEFGTDCLREILSKENII